MTPFARILLALMVLAQGLAGCTVRTEQTVQLQEPSTAPSASSTSASPNTNPTLPPGAPSAGSGSGQVVSHFPSNITVTVLDVGNASATLVQTAGAMMLFDTGSEASSDTVLGALRGRDIKTIDFLFLSNPQSSRTGGCEALIHAMPVKRVYQPGMDGDSPAWTHCKAATGGAPIQVYAPPKLAVRQVLRLDQYTSIEILHLGSGTSDPAVGSLAIRLDYGSFSMILASDNACAAQSNITTTEPKVQVDVIDVPLQGARGSMCESWLHATAPQSAFLSLAASGPPPDSDVLRDLALHGTRVYRTDIDGDITYTSDGASWGVRTAH